MMRPPAPPPRHPARILPAVYVVDDDPAMRRALDFVLSGAGFVVETFTMAEEFLRRYQPLGEECLVLNVHLPGMGGFALLEELRRRALALPVLMISGHVSDVEAARAIASGAFAVLEKPFAPDALVVQIHAALRQRLGPLP